MLRGWAGLCVAMSAGCVYLDDINLRPSAQIENLDPERPIYLASTLRLSAAKSTDPDGDALLFRWRARSCTTPAVCDPTPFASRTDRNPEFAFPVPSKQLLAVDLVVEDAHGATAESAQFFAVLNQDPAVSLTVQGVESEAGGYTVGRPVELYAMASDADGDELAFEWTLTPVPGSVPEAREWTELSATRYRLRADAPGLWSVRVRVADGDGGDAEVTRQILVEPDRPPCIEVTDPAAVAGARYVVERAAGPRRFAVLVVSDELDPYPPLPDEPDPDRGAATFAWWLRSPQTGGELAAVDDHALADLLLDPAAFAPGDLVDLRVEASDRVDRALPCGDDEPTCSIDGDGCLQRVTWGVEIR